jgi:uncharacterized RDD family membrane protein YckC
MNNIATPVQRFIAFIVDVLICITIIYLTVLFITFQSTTPNLLNAVFLSIIFLLLIYPLVSMFVVSFMTSKFGGDPGKILSGLAIINSKNQLISTKRAFFRQYIAKSFSGLFFGLGYLWIIHDPKQQAWHDQMADTFVINKYPKTKIIGVISACLLLALQVFLIMQIFSQVKAHASIYSELFANLENSLKSSSNKLENNQSPLPTITPSTIR